MANPYDALLDAPQSQDATSETPEPSPCDALIKSAVPVPSPYDQLLTADRDQAHQAMLRRTTAPIAPSSNVSGDLENIITQIASPVIQAGEEVVKTAAPIAQALGATDIEKNLRQSVKEYEGTPATQTIEGLIKGDAPQAAVAGTAAQLPAIGRQIGTAGEMLVAGAPAAIAQMGIQAFDKEYQRSGDAEQATAAVLKQAPQIALYWAASKIGAGALQPFLKTAPPIIKAIVGAGAATTTNAITSAAIRAADAEPGHRLEDASNWRSSLPQDALFGTVHGVEQGVNAKSTMKSVEDIQKDYGLSTDEAVAAKKLYDQGLLKEPDVSSETSKLSSQEEYPSIDAQIPSPEAAAEASTDKPSEQAATDLKQSVDTALNQIAPNVVDPSKAVETPVAENTKATGETSSIAGDSTDHGAAMAQDLGIKYSGEQEDGKHVYSVPVGDGNESSLTVKPDVTKDELQQKIADKQAEFSPSNDWSESTIPNFDQKPTSETDKESSQALGIVPPGMSKIVAAASAAGKAVKSVASAITGIKKFTDFRKSILRWSARNQKSTGEILRVEKELRKSVPSQAKREGITNWIQAKGDMKTLQDRYNATSDLKLKKGYEAAMKLTPEEIATAQKVRQTYDILLKRAQSYGINISEIEDYVNQIWKRPPLSDFLASSNRKLSTSVRFAKQRFHDSFFDGEQAGLKPETKDISKLLPIYMNEVNNAISAKQLVADMANGKAEDGRPLLAPAGAVNVEDSGASKSYFVLPKMPEKDTGDYKSMGDHPALTDWRWRAADENGNPIYVKGDLRVHPDIYNHLKNVLGNSAIREWYNSKSETPLSAIPKAATKFLLDDFQSMAKATMLGFLSPFHQVQEGTHAIGHKINPFSNIPKIDLSRPEQQDAASHGLMLLPDRVSANQFKEGLDGSRKNLLANIIGKAGKPGEMVKGWIDGYQNYLFHNYIPGLKLKTYDHILDRNMTRYDGDLKSGKITEDQVKYLSANQTNAAYGHLNYADMGRNPTIQHIAQTFLLAPDFLEARAKFTGQAVKGSVSKSGREQLVALATLAAVQYTISRILNKTIDGDYHWDKPFSVVVGNREYGMRSVPADIYKAYDSPRKFVSGRLSPIVGRGLLEGLSGVNYRGEPTTAAESLTNILSGMVPLTAQPFTRGLSETGKDNPVSPFEQFLGSLGLHVSRFSPVSEVYQKSHEWINDHGKEYGLSPQKAVFPISKYQQLRYALEDGDFEKANAEKQRLLAQEKITPYQLFERFKTAINHPFTGSEKTDRIFKKSLDARGQQVFNAAIQRRQLLIDRYRSGK